MIRQQYHYHNKDYYTILVIIFNNKMETIIDYRNAKYQGLLSIQKRKHGTGILIDDDLTFYCSTWKNNQLNGNTLIYLTHGKYIYGQWKNNQPNGINVFRFGETVLVASFQSGQISSRVLVIFQRYNFISILEISGQEMKVVERGQLYTNEDLINYVKLLDIKLPESYFSLVKYLCAFVSSDIKLIPNKKGDCYFGFDEGLALVFNNNNGIVSIGAHKNGDLVQFGRKCDHKCITQQGNFETNEVFQYKKQRPKQQIYSVFQKMHKRSLTFQNSYFHSKSSTIQYVQNLLRGKIAQIVEHSRQKITQAQLNDSLDYQPLTQQEYNQINVKRQNVYQTPKNSMKKTMSKIQQQPISSAQLNQQKTPKKSKTKIYLQKQIIQQKIIPPPIFVQKFNNLKKDPSLSHSKSKQKLSIIMPQNNYEKNSQNSYPYNEDTFSQKPPKSIHIKESYEPINMNIRRAKYENQNIYEQQQSAIINPKKLMYKQKSQTKPQIKPKNQSPYRLETKYEDLNERRSRLLKQFKNMNDVLKEESKLQKQHLQKLGNNRTSYDRRNYDNIKLERENYQMKNIRTNNHYIENLQKKQYQSPYAKQGMSRYISKKSDTQSNGCIPLSMAQLINLSKLEKQYEQIPRPKANVFQMTATFDNKNIYLSPTKRKAKLNTPLITVNEVQNVEQINASPLRQHNRQYQQKIGKFTPSQRKYQYYFD